MPHPADATPILDKLWTTMDALLDAADLVPARTPLEHSIEAAIRTCGRAILAARKAAELDEIVER